MFNSKEKKEKILKEAFENLKNNFLESLDPRDRTILFTASSDKLNKTSIVLNLARKLVRDKKKVIMVDMDLRQPSLSRISKVELNGGFSDVLVKEVPYENFITKDLYEKDLDLILSGRALVNAEDFLEIEKLKSFFASIRQKYDYILLDSPSNQNYFDANIIGQTVDKVFVITKNKDIRKHRLDATIEKLEEKNAQIAGIIKSHSK